jgi:hypothetical protein
MHSNITKDQAENNFQFLKPTESRLGKEGREVGAADVLRTFLLIDVSDGAKESNSVWLGLLMSFGHFY